METKIKLKLQEIGMLSLQLSGVINEETRERIQKGFLNENIAIKVRYRLQKISEKIEKEVANFKKLRNELIKRYGNDIGNGVYEVKDFIIAKNENDKDVSIRNPKHIEFVNELEALLDEEVELEYVPIPLSLIEDLKTENDYGALYKFFSEAQEK